MSVKIILLIQFVNDSSYSLELMMQMQSIWPKGIFFYSLSFLLNYTIIHKLIHSYTMELIKDELYLVDSRITINIEAITAEQKKVPESPMNIFAD